MSASALPQSQVFNLPTVGAQSNSTTSATPCAPTEFQAGSPSAYFDREPIVTSATVVGLLSALVTWAVSNDFLAKDDENLLLTIIPIFSAIAFAYYGRHGVTSVGKAQIAIDEAYGAEPGVGPKPKL